MSKIFFEVEFFNQSIGNWDVSSVIDLSEPFNGAESLRF